MIPKSFVISVLLVGLMLLSVAGCGDDVEPVVLAGEKTEDPTAGRSFPPVAKEDLLGSWEVFSIFGMTPEEYFESLAEGGEVEEKVKQFSYVFATDNSWTCNLVSETVFVFDDIPPGKMETVGTWSGTYGFDGLTLSLFTKGSDVQIVPEPKNILEIAFDLAIAEAEQHYDESFRSDFIKPFAHSTCRKQDGTLVLITVEGEEMVLEKR